MSEEQEKNVSQNLFDKFSNLKREAYSNLEQALSLDALANTNNGYFDDIIVMYENSLTIIERALRFFQQNKKDLATVEDASRTWMQLERMKIETTERLKTLRSKQSTQIESKLTSDFLKAGDDILIDNDDDCIIIDEILLNSDDDDCILIENDDSTHSNSNASKLNTSINKIQKKNDFSKATEILRVDNGVQLFYIASDGTVSTPSHPATLSIYSFNDDVRQKYRQKGSNVVGFVRVDSWMYPLIPNESPGMKTNFNAYIFPNQDEHLNFVGITFANKSANNDGMNFFEDVLANYGSLIYQDKNASSGIKYPSLPNAASSGATAPAMEKSKEAKGSSLVDEAETKKEAEAWTPDTIAQGVRNGAEYLSQGISATSSYATRYVNVGSDKLKAQLKPNEEPVRVSPTVQNFVRNVNYGTHVTVRVSSFVLNKLGAMAKYTAQTAAPYIKQGSTQLLAKTGVAGNKTNATSYVDGFCKVAGSSVEGFSVVYDSLEQAAKCLGKNVTNQTVNVVDYKYGTDAAKLTQNGMQSVGNIALTVNNVKGLKIVRTVAKETAKEVVKSKDSNMKINGETNAKTK
jgi:hypothetical protein